MTSRTHANGDTETNGEAKKGKAERRAERAKRKHEGGDSNGVDRKGGTSGKRVQLHKLTSISGGSAGVKKMKQRDARGKR